MYIYICKNIYICVCAYACMIMFWLYIVSFRLHLPSFPLSLPFTRPNPPMPLPSCLLYLLYCCTGYIGYVGNKYHTILHTICKFLSSMPIYSLYVANSIPFKFHIYNLYKPRHTPYILPIAFLYTTYIIYTHICSCSTYIPNYPTHPNTICLTYT